MSFVSADAKKSTNWFVLEDKYHHYWGLEKGKCSVAAESFPLIFSSSSSPTFYTITIYKCTIRYEIHLITVDYPEHHPSLLMKVHHINSFSLNKGICKWQNITASGWGLPSKYELSKLSPIFSEHSDFPLHVRSNAGVKILFNYYNDIFCNTTYFVVKYSIWIQSL